MDRTDVTSLGKRSFLLMPKYEWWYDAIPEGDIDSIKDTLNNSSKEQRHKLLNGKFVYNKVEKCDIIDWKSPDGPIFAVTAPLNLALAYCVSKDIILVSCISFIINSLRFNPSASPANRFIASMTANGLFYIHTFFKKI